MAQEVTLEQVQLWNRLSCKIAVAVENLNALCAEATQVGLCVDMNVHSNSVQTFGDMFKREYRVVSVRIMAPVPPCP